MNSNFEFLSIDMDTAELFRTINMAEENYTYGDYEGTLTKVRKVAENTAKYCDKGSLLNVIGTLSNNVYKDKNGVNHYQMSIIATKISFLSRGNKKEEKQADDVFVLGQ